MSKASGNDIGHDLLLKYGGDAAVRVPSKRVCRGDRGISKDVFRFVTAK